MMTFRAEIVLLLHVSNYRVVASGPVQSIGNGFRHLDFDCRSYFSARSSCIGVLTNRYDKSWNLAHKKNQTAGLGHSKAVGMYRNILRVAQGASYYPRAGIREASIYFDASGFLAYRLASLFCHVSLP